MSRVFIALRLPEEFAADVAALSRQLGAVVEGRFVPRENQHLTLAFLGEVDEAGIASAMDAMDAVCAGVCAGVGADADTSTSDGTGGAGAGVSVGDCVGADADVDTGTDVGIGIGENRGADAAPVSAPASILLRSDGLGKFGRATDATLWLGIEPVPELTALAMRLREELAMRGLTFDGKAFKPHITLARRARLPKGSLPQFAFPCDALATKITLFKSMLDAHGARYKELYSVEVS